MAFTCFGLSLWKNQPKRAAQTVEDVSRSQKDGSDAPPLVYDKDGLLRQSMSIASCSMSVVEAAGDQDPLRLNISFVPENRLPGRLSSLPVPWQTFSQGLPEVQLARTHASKDETSLIRQMSSQHMDGSPGSSQARMLSGADSTQSLDAAADMVLAQLGTVLEDPTAEVTSFKQAGTSDPRAPHGHANSLRESPEPATLPDIRAMCQDWGSITSPFAHRAAHVMSHASQSAEHEAETSARPLDCVASRSVDGSGALGDCDSHADSISKMLEAVREADACRTRSDDDASETLMCTSALLRKHGSSMHSSHSIAASPGKDSSGAQQCVDSNLMGSPHTCAGTMAGAAPQMAVAFMSMGYGASTYSEARAQRRRTRQITAQPDQENLLTMQSIREGPQSSVQGPLKSRTNLFRRRAGSLPSNTYRPLSAQGAYSPGHDDSCLTAGLSSIASGAQTGQGGCSKSHDGACSAGVVRSQLCGGQTGQHEMKQADCAPVHSRHDDASLVAALNSSPSGAQTGQHTVSKADHSPDTDCHEDPCLRAAYNSFSSGTQTRQHVVTREEAYKPGSQHLMYMEEIQPNMKPKSLFSGISTASQMHPVHTEETQPKAQFDRTSKVSLLKPPGFSSAAEIVTSTGNAAADAQQDSRPAAVHMGQKSSDKNDAETVHKALKSGEQHGGRTSERGMARRPTYMRSTASVKAKADVAERQIRSCMRKAAQQAKRRWSY